jgi:outer membrane protein assembly factor BamB
MGRKDNAAHVFCLDAETGREIWQYSFEQAFYEPNSTPAVDGSSVYALNAGGALVCLNTKNGKIRWQKDLRSDFGLRRMSQGWSTSPAVEGDMLLVNADTKALGLDKNTGNLVWSIEDEKPVGSWGTYASPVVCDINDTRSVLFLGPSRLNAVEVATGKKLWSFFHGDPIDPITDPIVSNNKVLISIYSTCVLLETNGTEPRELWNTGEFLSNISTAVLVDGYFFGTHWAGRYVSTNDWNTMRRLDWLLRCLSLDSGTVAWEQSMEHATLITADGKLIILGIKGTLRIAEATSSGYKELSSADVSGGKEQIIFATNPVLYNAKIYCRNFWGDLVCIDVSK